MVWVGEDKVQSFMSGVPIAVAQTTSYALLARACRVQATVAVEVSVDGTTWATLTNSTTVGENTSAMFVRCTTSTTCVVVCRPI